MPVAWNRKTAGRAGLVLVALVLFGIAVDRASRQSNDFDNFYDAAFRVWHDGELFVDKSTSRYPATFQVLMSPLGALPLDGAAAVWALLNLGCYGLLAWLFARWLRVPWADQRVAWFGVAPFLVSNITLGQNGPVLLALSTAGVLAAARGRAVGGGAALTLAGLLKVFPGALMAVPLALGRARGALAGAVLAGGVVALWTVSVLGLGPTVEDTLRWLAEVRLEQRPDALIESVRSLRYNNQGLAITLVRSLTTDFSWNPALAAEGSVQVASLPLPVAWGIYYAIVAALVATWCAVAWRLRRGETGPREFVGLQALAIPVLLSVSPIVWTHYFLWWLPALMLLSRHRAALVALGLVSLAGIFSESARALGLHMAITLGLFVAVARELWRSAPPREAGSEPERGSEPEPGTV
jgi:hypothetical protein